MIHCVSRRTTMTKCKAGDRKLLHQNLRAAKRQYPDLPEQQISILRDLTATLHLAIFRGELLFLGGKWYVSHSGLLRIAQRRRCVGIHSKPVGDFCDPHTQRWSFEATVYKTKTCRGFIGYGDADPSNVSGLVHGAEMRVAETRAVNRALRKAYGIGICSVEEISLFAAPVPSYRESKKLPPPPANGK